MLKTYAISLSVGILVGIIYAVMDVNSPAPPVIALLGLFGMLVGEQIVPLCQRLINRQPITLAWFRHECVPKISGTPPPSGDKTS
ncbi:XapX domain-containing protein [Pantoea sp. BIGb0393]|uniref:XapX domain-containing protein n=1 Tax=Pantoea nemavictus TaxID=2726955 RepID=A0ABU8PWQ4_9GAMM|nr:MULTISPECIES: XapX domain-containing protein [Pantoea]MBA0038046.1 XapX domain-containing protein [Pantoea nemavictus]